MQGMALPKPGGSWGGFLEQGSSSNFQLAYDDTEPPTQPMDSEALLIPEPQPVPPQLMTLEELLLAPGRTHLTNLHPKREKGSGWFEYTKGITKTIKRIMENDFPEPSPNWTSLSGDTKHRWFKAFAQKYNWDTSHTTLVREHFDSLCASRLLDRVHDWKGLWRNGENKPTWMKKSVWTGLIVYWTNHQNVRRSMTNSKNRNSEKGGFGISKHTCGSCPYTRMRENMRDEETGELPDMVTFMEKTHKRKKDGMFVDKKAEEIAKKCRALEEDKVYEMSHGEETVGDPELTQSERNAIFISEVKLKNGRRFGVGTMDLDPQRTPLVANDAQDYKQLYLETRSELVEATGKIAELSSQVKDAVYWSNIMRDIYPNHTPPISSNKTGCFC